MEIYEIIAWEGEKGWAFCLNCGDRDERYQPLYKDDFLPGQIVKCFRCGKVIRGKSIAGFRDNNLVFCLECSNPFTDEPVAEQDFPPGEKIVCHCCGKMIKEGKVRPESDQHPLTVL